MEHRHVVVHRWAHNDGKVKRVSLLTSCSILVLCSACSQPPAENTAASQPLPTATVTVPAEPSPEAELSTPEPEPEPEPVYVTLPLGQARETARAAMMALTGRGDLDVPYWGSWLQRKHLRLQKRGLSFDQALEAGAGAMIQTMYGHDVISFWIDRKEQDEANEALSESFVTVDCLLYNICD